MSQYIENVDIVAKVKTTADTSGLSGDIKKVLEKPFQLKLDADATGLFNDIRKDIGKIEKTISGLDFGNLSQSLAQAIQVGAVQGSKSVEETLADLKIQQKNIKDSQVSKMKEIGLQQYDKLIANMKETFKDQATFETQMKKLAGFKDRISQWGTVKSAEYWQNDLMGQFTGSPDMTKLIKKMVKDMNSSIDNELADSRKELQKVTDYFNTLDSVHVTPTFNIEGLTEALGKLQNFKQLMDQILIDGGNTSFGSAMQGMYNVSDELHRAFTKGSTSDSMYLNVSGVNAMKASLASLNKAIGEFGDTSKFKNLQEILEHLATTVSSLADSFKVMADNSMKSSSFYEKQIEQETTKLQSINEELDEQIRKREQIQDLVNTTSQADSGKNKHSGEFLQIQAAMNYYNHVAKEMSEIQEDIKQFEKEANDSNNENQIQAKQDLEEAKQRLERYKTIQVSPDETLFNDKKLGQGALNKAKQGVALLREFMKAGGNIEDLDIKGLDKNSAIYKLLSADSDVTKAEIGRNNNIRNRTESLDKIKGYEKQLELARIAESANQPQDSADSTPLDLKVDEFNASLDSTSSHFERLNTALSSTVDGLNKQDAEQEQPKKKKASKYAIDDDTYNNVRDSAIENAKSFIGDREYLDLDVKHLESGVAKVTAKIKEATGEWINFSATVSDTGELLGIRTPTSKTGSKLDLRLAKEKADGTHLSIDDQKQQIQRLRQELKLDDAEKWSISVDTNGFITIKNNLEQIGNASLQATQKFQNTQDALNNFNKEALTSTVSLTNQVKNVQEAAEQTGNSLEAMFNSFKSGNYDKNVFDKLNAYNTPHFDFDTFSFINAHANKVDKLKTLMFGKTNLSDFNESELEEFTRLANELTQMSSQAKLKLDALADSYGKLIDQDKLLRESNKMLTYLENNSKAAEKYGDTIKQLAKDVKTAFTETAFKDVSIRFERIKGNIISEGLTGKLKGLTVSDANINKISSALETKSLDAKINKLKELYKMYSQVGLATSASLTGAMTNIDANFEALGQINISEASDDDLRNLVNTYNDLIDAIKLAENELKELQRTHGRVMSDSEKTIASNQIKKWLQDNSRAAKVYGEELERLAQKMKEVTTETQYKDVLSQFKSITSKAAAEGLLGRSIWGSFKETFGRISELFGSYSIVDIFQDLGREGVENIRLIDASLTDLQMSARLSKNEAKELMETYGQLGDDMAILSTDLASATTSWIKQGESLENATKLAQDSTVLSVLGEMETEDAATYLTSALKGYQLASDQAMDVVDKISTVDIMSATSVGGLAEGMSEVATQANLVGISFDELLGYLAAIGEVTQDDMGSVGGALNTIFARMGNIKLGRLKDYQNDLETDLSNVETVLRGEGIDLRDEMGQFRDFNDVLNETAARWDSFSSISQNAIAQAFAGTHRRESFLVLMQNYQKAQQYAEASANSSGSAMERYDVYLDSLEAKITRLQNAFQSLSTTVVNSDFAKGLVDAGTSVITMLDGFIERVGSLNTIIGGFAIGKGIHSFVKNFDKSVYICKLG